MHCKANQIPLGTHTYLFCIPNKTRHSYTHWVGNDRLAGDFWVINVCLKWIWLLVRGPQEYLRHTELSQWQPHKTMKRLLLVIDRYLNPVWRGNLVYPLSWVATSIKTVNLILSARPQQDMNSIISSLIILFIDICLFYVWCSYVSKNHACIPEPQQ